MYNILDNISDAKLNRIVTKFANRKIKEEDRVRKFFESPKFNAIINKIKKGKEVEDDQLHKVFQAITLCYSDKLTKDETDFIETYCIEYKGIRFYVMFGQGTHISTSIVKNDT